MAILGASWTAPLAAQSIRGVVSERDTYQPIDLATVLLLTERLDTLGQTITNAQGYFTFDLPDEGSYYVIASAIGYRPVRGDLVALSGDEIKVVEISMAVRPVALGGLVVETEGGEAEVPGLVGTGFYERFEKGQGQFLLPGQVARSSAHFTAHLFRELTWVRVRQSSMGPGFDAPSVANLTGGFCEPWIYIDDRLWQVMPGEGLEDAVPRDRVEAIEVYMYPFGPPMRYFRDLGPAACGVILIWTKRY